MCLKTLHFLSGELKFGQSEHGPVSDIREVAELGDKRWSLCTENYSLPALAVCLLDFSKEA